MVSLPPLRPEGTRELADASLGAEEPGSLPDALYGWLHEASGGLPGKVQQLLCHLIDRGDLVYRRGEWKPRRAALARLADQDAAEALDWRRLEGLDEGPRSLLEAAAVVGEPFRASLLAEIAERPVEEIWTPLTELVDQGFLERWMEPEGASYAIAGGRLRDGLYTALDPSRRATLHGRLGALLARRVEDGAGELAARAAEHLWRGGEREAALPHLMTAGRDAVAIHGHGEAAAHFGRAAEAAEATGAGEIEREARAGRARALALTGHPGRALREYQRLLDEPEPPDGPAEDRRRETARAHLEMSRLQWRLGEHPAALEGFEAGPGGPRRRRRGRPHHRPAPRQGGRPQATSAAPGRPSRPPGSAPRRPAAPASGRQRAFLVNTLAMMFFARGDWRRAGRLARWGLRGALAANRRDGAVPDPHIALLLRNTLAMVRWKTGDFDAASALYAENLPRPTT